MSEHISPLITYYQHGWERYQRAIVASVTQLSSEQLALPVAPHYVSIGDLLAHMIDARVAWFGGWLGEALPDVTHWEEERAPQDAGGSTRYKAAALVAQFEQTWRVIATAMPRWTTPELEQMVAPPAAHQAWLRSRGEDEEPPHTRQWIVWHVMEHEIHHGGELSLALGAYGLDSFYTW